MNYHFESISELLNKVSQACSDSDIEFLIFSQSFKSPIDLPSSKVLCDGCLEVETKKKFLGINIDQDDDEWPLLLAHEYGHLIHWQSDKDRWIEILDAYNLLELLDKLTPTVSELKKAISLAVETEHFAESFALKYALEHGWFSSRGETFGYIQGMNAYIFSYVLTQRYRIYNIDNFILEYEGYEEKMPIRLLFPEEILEYQHPLESEIVNNYQKKYGKTK